MSPEPYPHGMAKNQKQDDTPKPEWNTGTQGPPPAGREDQYTVVDPPAPGPVLDPSGQAPEGDKK